MTLSVLPQIKEGLLPPQVEIAVAGTSLVGASTTLYRVDPDGHREPVRTLIDYPTTGPVTVTDYECPFYTDVRYYAEAVTGGVTTTSPSSQVVRMCFDLAWLSDPLDPSSGMRVWVANWPQQNRDVPQDVLTPLGTDSVIGITGVRKRPDYSIALTHPTAEGTDALRRLLNTANPVLLRTPDPVYGGWTGGYLLLGDVKENRWASLLSVRTRIFDVPVHETSGPTAAGVISLWTWGDVYGLYSTWGAIPLAKATWGDVLRNPTPGS